MIVRRKLLVLAIAAVVAVLITAMSAAPADAHGALENPVSRAAACGSEGGATARMAACVAARAASGAGTFAWDNLRVANVDGRDREVIPDGKLCSGGKRAFAGLDLARTDWPATRLTSGARFGFTYRGTIPHPGTFRLYVTKDSYDPSQPLRWSDLETEPFMTATDPPLRGGSYAIAGRLPRAKTGRHLIYTIWQTNPDTYYSCSDVVFKRAVGGGEGAAPAPVPAPAESTPATAPDAPAPVPPPTASPTAPGAGDPYAAPVAVKTSTSRSNTAMIFGGVGVAGVLLVGVVLAFLRRRRA